MKEQLETLKFYMPLTATTHDYFNDEGELESDDFEREYLSSNEIACMEDKILEEIALRNSKLDQDRGLMAYFTESDSVNQKVERLDFSVEVARDGLMGVAVCQIKEPLSLQETDVLKEYITGQAADGWGEGFEQREISHEGRNISVHFWDSEDWELSTAEELGMEEQGMGGMK